MNTGRPEAGEYYADLYNRAMNELAALREELELSERNRLAAERRYYEMATARDCIATNYNQLSYGATICKDKLGAAEQRNAELVSMLTKVRDSEVHEGRLLFDSITKLIELTKPTESGASE